jgi:hypothetical protein
VDDHDRGFFCPRDLSHGSLKSASRPERRKFPSDKGASMRKSVFAEPGRHDGSYGWKVPRSSDRVHAKRAAMTMTMTTTIANHPSCGSSRSASSFPVLLRVSRPPGKQKSPVTVFVRSFRSLLVNQTKSRVGGNGGACLGGQDTNRFHVLLLDQL